MSKKSIKIYLFYLVTSLFIAFILTLLMDFFTCESPEGVFEKVLTINGGLFSVILILLCNTCKGMLPYIFFALFFPFIFLKIKKRRFLLLVLWESFFPFVAIVMYFFFGGNH